MEARWWAGYFISLCLSLHYFWEMSHQQPYDLRNGQLVGLYLMQKKKKSSKLYISMFVYFLEPMDALEREIGWIVLLWHTVFIYVCTQRQMWLLVYLFCSLVLSSKFLLAIVKCVNFIVSEIRTYQDPTTAVPCLVQTKWLSLLWLQNVSLFTGDVFIHSFNKYLMSFYYVPGTVLGAGNIAANNSVCVRGLKS